MFPELTRIYVAADPSVSDGESSAETGIITAGAIGDSSFYVLADSSVRGSVDERSRRIIAQYDSLEADLVIVEDNNGGDWISAALKSVRKNLPVKSIKASRGKQARAEPIAALYEQGRVFHAMPMPDLEDQLCGWVPDTGEASPDRLDALVWALTALSQERRKYSFNLERL